MCEISDRGRRVRERRGWESERKYGKGQLAGEIGSFADPWNFLSPSLFRILPPLGNDDGNGNDVSFLQVGENKRGISSREGIKTTGTGANEGFASKGVTR